MVQKAYAIELLTRNKKVRYGLTALLALALVGVIAYDKLSTRERIRAEKIFDCPALDQGCQIEVRNSPYTIKTNLPIAVGIPFVLSVEGGGVEMRASWKMKDAIVESNYYHMKSAGADRWKADMVLPSSQKAGHEWILHMEINARAVDINTVAH